MRSVFTEDEGLEWAGGVVHEQGEPQAERESADEAEEEGCSMNIEVQKQGDRIAVLFTAGDAMDFASGSVRPAQLAVRDFISMILRDGPRADEQKGEG